VLSFCIQYNKWRRRSFSSSFSHTRLSFRTSLVFTVHSLRPSAREKHVMMKSRFPPKCKKGHAGRGPRPFAAVLLVRRRARRDIIIGIVTTNHHHRPAENQPTIASLPVHPLLLGYDGSISTQPRDARRPPGSTYAQGSQSERERLRYILSRIRRQRLFPTRPGFFSRWKFFFVCVCARGRDWPIILSLRFCAFSFFFVACVCVSFLCFFVSFVSSCWYVL
jgi:hypothetical protein